MPKSSNKFEQIFLYYLHEDIDTTGALGGSPGGFNPPENINSSDFYAPGDARRPKVLGGIQTRGTLIKKKKKKRKKKNSVRKKRD
tara:strand:+ start:202 stop:456 length:255 start_codon:yes stop_codon:yes gene_type:complete